MQACKAKHGVGEKPTNHPVLNKDEAQMERLRRNMRIPPPAVRRTVPQRPGMATEHFPFRPRYNQPRAEPTHDDATPAVAFVKELLHQAYGGDEVRASSKCCSCLGRVCLASASRGAEAACAP